MKKENPEVKWKATKGRVHRNPTRSNPCVFKPGEVSVQENAKDMDLGDSSKDPYGIPINPKLGITLISDFHHLLDESIRKTFLEDREFDLNEFDFRNKDKVKLLEKSVNQLINILKKSAAITIEKSILLKTLSQPGCQGVRFYLCSKSIPKDSKAEIFISLVTVGVDEEGTDLLYERKTKEVLSQKKVSSNIQNMSLIGEYGHPPGSGFTNKKSLDKVYDERYVLLNYAVQESRNRK